MASGFATLSKDEILAVNEAAAPTSTRKRQNLACRCLLVCIKKFLAEFESKSKQNYPRNTVN